MKAVTIGFWFAICILLYVVYEQDSALINQARMIHEMTQNPACMVNK